MKKNSALVFYVILFLAAVLILRLFDIVDISASELLSYIFCIYGIAVFYNSFGKKKRLELFTGTATFLAGVFLFITNKFVFFDTYKIIMPAVIFIFGAGGIMLYVDDKSDKKILFISLLFIIFAFVFAIILGSLSFLSFFYAVFYIMKKYWIAVLILFFVLLFLKREE